MVFTYLEVYNHFMKSIFISGIPTSGKSHLAKKLAEETGAFLLSTDDLREEMHSDPQYTKWVDFYLNQDEETYYTSISPEEQWRNLVDQSEAMWPFILQKILSIHNNSPLICEGVNILPHLAHRDLPFSGVVLIGQNRESVYERVKKEHRWGNTEKLWNFEADSFFNVERPRYKEEADKYGYAVFETSDEAYETARKMILE